MFSSLARAHHDMLRFKIGEQEMIELLTIETDCLEVTRQITLRDPSSPLADIYFEYYVLLGNVVKFNTICINSIIAEHYVMLERVVHLNQALANEILPRHYRLVYDIAYLVDIIFDQLHESHRTAQNFLLLKLSLRCPILIRLKSCQIRIISKLGYMMLRVVHKLHNKQFDKLVIKHLKTTIRISMDPTGASHNELTALDSEGTSLQYLIFDYYSGLSTLSRQWHCTMKKFLRKTKCLLTSIA